jgi:membrane protein required for colicin V production
LSKLLSKTAKILLLGWLNRLLGAVFGLLEGILLVVIVLFLVSFTPYERTVRSIMPNAPVVKFMKNLMSPFNGESSSFGFDLRENTPI